MGFDVGLLLVMLAFVIALEYWDTGNENSQWT